MNVKGLQSAFQGFDINNLDFKTSGTWPAGVKFVCYLLVMASFIGAGVHFLITDKHQAVQREMSREADLKREFENKSFRVANLDALRRQMADVEERFAEILNQLPSEKEVPALLEDISEIGRQAGLNIQTIALQPERRSQFLIELPINIEVTGTYHQMGAFVSGVAEIERIVTLHDFNIQGGSGELLSMTINARTYRYEQN